MFKKWMIVFAVFLISQSAFPANTDELNLDFFSRFNDDCLTYYIKTALENNHDLKKAGFTVEQYRQQAKYSLGQELPSLSVSANYLGIHISELDNFNLARNAFVLPFMASYEPDFLLKNRDKTRSAKKAYEAAQYEEKSIYLSLLSDVATVYTNILQYDKLIELQQDLVKSAEQIYIEDNKKYSSGVVNTTYLNNSNQTYEQERITLEELEKQRSTLLMQLAVLCGISSDYAGDLERGKLADFEYSDVIPSEIVSDVIYSRPDVMEAEANLEKARIDVRVARKEFLPSFNITGSWVFSTLSPGTFFSWESSIASILAGATQDIFKGGMKVANLRMQKAKYQELFEDYKQVDLDAVKEVNTALCVIKHDTASDESTDAVANLQMKNFNNTEKMYNHGVVSYPDYLSEYRRVLSVQKDNTQTKTQRLVDYFTLYKAVGGKL